MAGLARLAGWATLLATLVACRGASAPGSLSITAARLANAPDGPHIALSMNYKVPPALLEALHAGVAIRYAWVAQWRGSEGLLGAPTLATHQGQLQIDYRSFTQWYTLSGTTARTPMALPDLPHAESAMGRVRLPLESLEPPPDARGLRVRIALDVGALPPTLRLPAYLSADWHQDSGWFDVATSTIDDLEPPGGPGGADPAYH